jgi:hypothetical protein
MRGSLCSRAEKQHNALSPDQNRGISGKEPRFDTFTYFRVGGVSASSGVEEPRILCDDTVIDSFEVEHQSFVGFQRPLLEGSSLPHG